MNGLSGSGTWMEVAVALGIVIDQCLETARRVCMQPKLLDHNICRILGIQEGNGRPNLSALSKNTEWAFRRSGLFLGALRRVR